MEPGDGEYDGPECEACGVDIPKNRCHWECAGCQYDLCSKCQRAALAVEGICVYGSG